MSKNYDVSRHPSGGYQGKGEGARRPSVVAPTQREAIDRTRAIMQGNDGGELRIHSNKGSIRASDTVPPKKDNFPPRG